MMALNLNNDLPPATIDQPNSLPAKAGEVDSFFSNVYDRLKVMAHRELYRASGNTLNTTALVHELYMKLSASRELNFGESVKFFAYAAMAMRHILIDRALRRVRSKFGGSNVHVALDDVGAQDVSLDPQLALQLDAAIRELEKDDPRAARVVELHYFAGLSLDRVGELLGVVRRTVERDWRYARAYLQRHVGKS